MTQKQFKILRTRKETTIASALTNRLQTLTLHMERLQAQYPDDEFKIVDQHGNPAQIDDFIAAKLPPKEKKQAAQLEEVKRRLKRCS